MSGWNCINLIALAGVANSVQQVQDLEQATRSGFITIQDKQDEQDAVNTRQKAINASVLQMVAARGTTGSDGIDDNATVFSALTASSAVKDRRIIDLELQLWHANTNTVPPPTGGGSAFPGEVGEVAVEVVVEVVVMVVEVAVVVVAVLLELIAVELMDLKIWPRIANTGMRIPTAGHVGMIVQRIMIVQHVIIKHQDTNLQRPDLIQWEDPSKTKNTLSGTEKFGSNKQIILRQKRLTHQQKQ
jgi:hypothetical protein